MIEEIMKAQRANDFLVGDVIDDSEWSPCLNMSTTKVLNDNEILNIKDPNQYYPLVDKFDDTLIVPRLITMSYLYDYETGEVNYIIPSQSNTPYIRIWYADEDSDRYNPLTTINMTAPVHFFNVAGGSMSRSITLEFNNPYPVNMSNGMVGRSVVMSCDANSITRGRPLTTCSNQLSITTIYDRFYAKR